MLARKPDECKPDLVHASVDVAIGEPLDLLAGLDEETAVRDADGHAAPILQPHGQAREARLAVDGQKVQVIVVPCIARPCSTMPLQVHTYT